MSQKFVLKFKTGNSGQCVLTGRVRKDGTVTVNGLDGNDLNKVKTFTQLQTVADFLNGQLKLVD